MICIIVGNYCRDNRQTLVLFGEVLLLHAVVVHP